MIATWRGLRRAVLLVAGTSASNRHALAEAPAETEERFEPSSAAAAVNTPLPTHTQLRFKPSYTFPHDEDRYKAELLFEGVLPYDGVFVPDLAVSGFWSVARVRLPADSQQTSSGTASGLGDLSFVDLAAHRVGFVDLGAGLGTVFPMATNPALGQGKWQLGPAVGVRLDNLARLKIAALVQNLYSVAGNSTSPNLAYVSVQPFVTLHLSRVVYLASDATMTFYWVGGKTSVPVDLILGSAFSNRFVGAVQGWYTLAGSGQGEIKTVVELTFVLGASN